MSESTVRFGLLCSMFQAMGRDRSAAKKRKRFRTFLDRVYTGREYFSAVRLILPSLDRERGSYGLKESALAAALVDALAISKDSDDALRLINWRKGGARTGANAGNFALVAADILQRRQGLSSGGMTIRDVNDALDQLSLKEGRGEKAAVLSDLIKKTNAVEMKWILMIILKDLKLGISEKSIFHEFHPDAEDLFNVTCDLKLVCEKLKDSGQRHKRQDIEVGRAVRPQLAMRISDATTAWRKVLQKEAFQKQMLEKLIWICAFMLVGARHPGATVGIVEKDYRIEVTSLIAELRSAAAAERRLTFDEGMEERLCAYSRAVAHFPTAVKEFKWRNGWFYSLTEKALALGKDDPCPLHTAWLKEINII